MSKIFRGPLPDEPLETGNLVSYMFRDAHRWNNLRALECGYTGKSLTYGELRDAVGRWGAWLSRHRGGATQPFVVTRYALCSMEVAVVQLGTTAVGAVSSALNSKFGAREVADQIDECGASVIAASVDFLPRLKEALEKLGRQIPVVILGDAQTGDNFGLNILTSYEEIMKDETLTPVEPIEISGEETALLLYTSGTTGLPKSMEHSHNGLIFAARTATHPRVFPYGRPTGEADQIRWLVIRDFGIAFGLLWGILPALSVGACMIILRLDEDTFVSDVERLKPNITGIVPPNFPVVMRLGKERPDLLKTLRHVCVGGGPLLDRYVDAWDDEMPGVFLQRAYGASEMGIIVMDPASGGKAGFTGQICPNVRVKVLDDKGELLPPNKPGYIYAKNPSVMKGYLDKPVATREILDDAGWCNTGDIGLVDDDGYIKTFDRVKELMKLDDAVAASPTELENTILDLPEVYQVCVVGAQIADTGMDAIYVFAVKNPDLTSDVTEDFIKNYVAKQLNEQKRPKRVIFMDALPRNQNGKMDRKFLNDKAAELENSN